jgi:hypothetical protein
MIDYINISYLIAKINEGMRLTFHDLAITEKNDSQQNINDVLFSIFILL